MSHRVVNPDSLLPPVGFSHAVVAVPGRMVFLGGQTGHRRDGSLPEGLLAQFRGALGNLRTVLDAAGARVSDLTSMQIYVTDAAAYRAAPRELGRAWNDALGRHYPAMALFEVAGLHDPDALVELVTVAVIPPDVRSRRPRGATVNAVPNPSDLLGLQGDLSDEERAVADVTRQFVRDQFLPVIADHYEDATFPVEVAKTLGELGLLGMHLDGYGCAGTNAVSYGLACLELEAGDSGLRSFVSVQGSLAMFPIWRYGTEEQKQRWLPAMARGEVIGCFGLTEPDHGSDPAGMRTVARRDGDDWVLNGTKLWITNGTLAQVAIVWARTDEGIRGFIVPTDTPGFTARDVGHKLSLRASATSELSLVDCRLPADALLEGANGLAGPLSCLNEARFGIVWGTMGAARACFEAALDYARTREQFDRPIAAFQLTQRKLVEMLLELTKGTLLAHRLGRMKDAGELTPQHVSLGKLNNARVALEIARSARSVLGANGITLEYPVMRHMTNLESVATYEGTEEIHTLTLGRLITGVSAFA